MIKNSLVLKLCQLTSIYITWSQQKICILNFWMPSSTIKKGHCYTSIIDILVNINYKILFSDDDNGKGKELPGTSGRWTLIQDKIVEGLAKLNKQLADMLSLKQSGLFLVTDKDVKELEGKIHNLEMNLKRMSINLSLDLRY